MRELIFNFQCTRQNTSQIKNQLGSPGEGLTTHFETILGWVEREKETVTKWSKSDFLLIAIDDILTQQIWR